MNQQAILQSNLLDIIFENRNKDYGAYKLRKTYQGRLSIAVFSTVGIAVVLSLVFLSENSLPVFTPVHTETFIPGAKISGVARLSKPVNKKMEMHQAAVKNISKSIAYPDRTPLIIAGNINTLPATPSEFQPSLTGNDVPGTNASATSDVTGEGGLDKTGAPGKADLPEPGRPAPAAFAEIMPQYPGGVAALLSFLKKNIHAPANVEEGEDVSVKVEFVVNYDGSLENFIVVKSGGEIFDNEVIRVLKKMPLWIPGKSRGKTVAVYYTIPVKFTGEF